ncbi:trypsin-like serine protease [Nocardia sp. NPDC024068]|uniref:trypsin-like serine protease n=1 Tax=Nocardia sp. NPDC024068 TaxID=3157197 RepID=UPI0033FA3191
MTRARARSATEHPGSPILLALAAAAAGTALLAPGAGADTGSALLDPGSATGSAATGSAMLAPGSAEGVAVGPGSSLGLCSVTATGYADGQLVALTAGHCTLGLFGVIRLPYVDWAMIPLLPGTRTHNTLPDGKRLVATGPPGGSPLCRYGQVSGTRCAGYTDICIGDSGGPVYRHAGKGTAVLVGITSSNLEYSSLPVGFELGEP